MFHFMPKSSATTWGRRRPSRDGLDVRRTAVSKPGSHVEGPGGMTSLARSRPTRPGLAAGLGDERGVVEVGRREDALHRAADAGQPDEGPGVDPLDAEDAVLGQVVVERPAARGSCSRAGSARGRRSPRTQGRPLSASSALTP